VRITLNGDPYELDRPLSVGCLLEKLEIDTRSVAVEHNRSILKRPTFTSVTIQPGDVIEIVNFVGGGSRRQARFYKVTHGQ